jgi:hypothetical protein
MKVSFHEQGSSTATVTPSSSPGVTAGLCVTGRRLHDCEQLARAAIVDNSKASFEAAQAQLQAKRARAAHRLTCSRCGGSRR